MTEEVTKRKSWLESKVIEWLIDKVGSKVATIIVTAILTSGVGFGGTYFMGFITAPSEIKRLNENRMRDSNAVVIKFDSLISIIKKQNLRIEITEQQIKSIQKKSDKKQEKPTTDTPSRNYSLQLYDPKQKLTKK